MSAHSSPTETLESGRPADRRQATGSSSSPHSSSSSRPPKPSAPRTASRWLVLGAMAATLVLWASAFVAIRHLGHDVPPGALSLGRLLVASVALGVLVFRRRPTWPRGSEWALLLVCGVAWFGIYNLALNDAERRIDAGTAALLVQIGPIIVAVLATVFLGERMTAWLIIGMVVGFGGVAIIARGFSNGGTGDRVGVWLAVLAAVTYAIGVLVQKPLLRRLPGPEVNFLACIIGVVSLLPWSGELVTVVRDAEVSSLLWIAYLGIFPTAVAFSLWAFVLARSDAGKLTLTTFLVPFIATLIAWALLGEIPAAMTFVGGALCIAGVLLTRRKPRPRSTPIE